MRTGEIVERVSSLLMAGSFLIPTVGKKRRQYAELVESQHSVSITPLALISLKVFGVVAQDLRD